MEREALTAAVQTMTCQAPLQTSLRRPSGYVREALRRAYNATQSVQAGQVELLPGFAVKKEAARAGLKQERARACIQVSLRKTRGAERKERRNVQLLLGVSGASVDDEAPRATDMVWLQLRQPAPKPKGCAFRAAAWPRLHRGWRLLH
eukprot:2688145-Pleurochrysis_carterae.AAC.7